MDKRKVKTRMKIRRLCAISAAVLMVLMGLTGAAYCWNHETTHMLDLTGMALDLLKLDEETKSNQEYSPEIWKEFATFIQHGARDEDLPCRIATLRDSLRGSPISAYFLSSLIPQGSRLVTHDLRANNHYGHGIVNGIGLTCSLLGTGDADTAPLHWAKTNSIDWRRKDPSKKDPIWTETNGDFSQEEEFKKGQDWRPGGTYNWTPHDLSNGNMSWKNAIDRYGYTEESKALAYYTLGFVLHLLEDMGEPEHVHDDPHGASSVNGFEIYMEKNWNDEDKVKPDINSLHPWRPKSKASQGGMFADIDDYFVHLGKLAYSSNRFRGFFTPGGNPSKIEEGSDLERMFDKEWVDDWRLPHDTGAGFLTNKPGVSDISGMMKFDSGYYDAVTYKANDEGYLGQFWPTYRELENKGKTDTDAEGYYYIELSGDIPYLSPKRHIYPAAYLPSPLKGVEQECQGWRTENPDGKHLYYFIAKYMAPHIVEHAAGLIQHYFEIVNHPPYVERVLAKGTFAYQNLSVKGGYASNDARWSSSATDALTGIGTPGFSAVREGTDSIRDVVQRGLVSYSDLDFGPGKTSIEIYFSEPVRDVEVRIEGMEGLIKGELKPENTIWEGSFIIPYDGPQSETLRIFIEANDLNPHYEKDKNPHYKNVGGKLDKNPETPARRRVSENGYEWEGYEDNGGVDEKHSIRVFRRNVLETGQLTEPKATQGDCKDTEKLRQMYFRKCLQMRTDYEKLNCTPIHTDCALEPRGCWNHIITNALPCEGSQGRTSCGRKLLDNYRECVDKCNHHFVSMRIAKIRYDLKGCADGCDETAKDAVEACHAGAIDPPNRPTPAALPTSRLPGSESSPRTADPIAKISGTWEFGRVISATERQVICHLTLTRERVEKIGGYTISGNRHPNESFWGLEGENTIWFKHADGKITSKMTRREDGYWEGEYIEHKDAPVRGKKLNHYIKRVKK